MFPGIKAKNIYLKITKCSFLQLFALVCEDMNNIQVIFQSSLYSFSKWHKCSFDLEKLTK